jgi:hypothetical protein
MVHEFYEQQSHRTYARDPQALCDHMGRNVSVKITGHLGGQTTTASYDGGILTIESIVHPERYFQTQ